MLQQSTLLRGTPRRPVRPALLRGLTAPLLLRATCCSPITLGHHFRHMLFPSLAAWAPAAGQTSRATMGIELGPRLLLPRQASSSRLAWAPDSTFPVCVFVGGRGLVLHPLRHSGGPVSTLIYETGYQCMHARSVQRLSRTMEMFASRDSAS
ncbi:hypothetical protein GGR56DRAFT_152197 [Xylariaceae sp. FL0804]|nr:hypothetical protein GGR56DRAFT_248409 [Xylariaceae sp. FL0804]KAI0470078.1 hypothetical protein GGR56DRAFT_152197 [Xylariaceae sp. FL0804]